MLYMDSNIPSYLYSIPNQKLKAYGITPLQYRKDSAQQ